MSAMKKKPSLEIILGLGHKSDHDDGGDDYQASEGKIEAAKQLMSALKSNDAEGVCEAVCALVDFHLSEDEEEEGGEEHDKAEHEEQENY